MNDPVGERLRSYYQSIQRDAPARLEARVAHALDSAASARPALAPWRPAFGLLAAGAIIVVVALVVRDLGPAPTTSPSSVTGPSSSPTVTSSETAEPSPSGEPTPSSEPSETPGGTTTPSPTGMTDQFTLTGSMTVGRDGPTATLLKNGRVLVVGGKVARGLVEGLTATAELYDPATGKFAATRSMADARWGHTATLLNDGRVLVVGGADLSDGFSNLKTAELYDPATGKFTPTGSMAVGRASHTATLLKDGRVLIAGGTNSIGLDSAEIYDPATGKFTATGTMTIARQDHAATLLQDGWVLIAGGTANGTVGPFGPLASAELYNPATGKFTASGSMAKHRQGPTATLLPDGTVMVTSGRDENSAFLNSAEQYDPATGTFSGRGAGIPDFAKARTATLLSGGILLTIGWNAPGATATYYDGGKYSFYGAGSATKDVACQTATLLPDGRVLLVGGVGVDGKPSATATLFAVGLLE